MEKVLVIVSDNNKGRYIAKGFTSAFKEMHYFVVEKKIYDLNIDEINKYSPDIIFTFWSDISQCDELVGFLNKYDNPNTVYIDCAELKEDIPSDYIIDDNHYIFATNAKNKFKLCISPKDYKSKFQGYNYNITFAGNPSLPDREKTLAKLIYNFGSINIFCRSFDFYKSLDDMYKNKLLNEYFLQLYKDSYKGYVETQKELAQIYTSSKINIDMKDNKCKYLNYRCLEILASGSFLIAPYSQKIVSQFDDGKDLETYKNDDELIDKIKFYFKNLNLAQLISLNGKKNAVTNFSFYDRLKSILKVIYGKNISSR